MSLDYKAAGVDKEAGYKQVSLIKEIVKETHTAGVVSELGGFAGLFQPDLSNMQTPVLVSGTDGVGTKVDLAFRMDKHNTVGIDCVAMCVNDILCQGAKPLFFLDYIATGKLVPEKMASVVEGVAEGCKQAGAALIGGETAEMPGIYQENHYDLAGFAVGIVDKSKIITADKVSVGDRLIGLPSSGLHSNGFSLVRKIIFEKMNFSLDDWLDELDMTLGQALLEPTKIYVNAVLPLLEKYDIHAISHITGGGVYENLPRVLKDGQEAVWDLSDYSVPKIFQLIQEWGNVETKEMFSTFNMGIGLVMIVDQEDVTAIMQALEEAGEKPILMGEIKESDEKKVTLCKG